MSTRNIKIGLSKQDKLNMKNEIYDEVSSEVDKGLKVSGTDTSTNILAFTENKGIYVATDTGGWYYWKQDVSKYVYGGVYQALEIEDGSVTTNKLENTLKNSIEELSNLSNVTEKATILPKFVAGNGSFSTYTTYSCLELIVNEGETYFITGSHWNNGVLYAFYNDDVKISYENLEGSGITVVENFKVIVPKGANKLYVNIGPKDQNNNTGFRKYAIVTYEKYFGKVDEIINNNINNDFYSQCYVYNFVEQEIEVTKTMYNVSGGTQINESQSYWNGAILDLNKDTKKVIVSAFGANSNFPAVLFKDEAGKVISSYSTATKAIIDVELEVPNGATQIALNNYSSNIVLKCSFANLSDKKNVTFGDLYKNFDDYVTYDIRGNSLVNQNNKNPFTYLKFDKPYYIIVFDDGRRDLDLVASICEEYNIPLSVAIPPQTLTDVCNGLTSPKGSYSVGMTIKEVCNKIVELGGEVFAHRYEIVTTTNQYDNDFMYDHFVNTKKQLEDNGFKIRGIIKAGGGNAINQTEEETMETLKWCLKFYDYSDCYAPTTNLQYGKYRLNFGSGVDNNKSRLDNLKTWYMNRFDWGYAHTLDGSETNVNEANFRAIIEYALSIGIEFTTMSYLFDNFKSSELEDRIKALENK